MICNNCGAENESRSLVCSQCGVILVDIFAQVDKKNIPIELRERAQNLKSFGELKESNFYIPEDKRIDRNSAIKKSLYEYLLKRAELISEDRKVQEKKKHDEEVNEGLTLYSEEIIAGRGKENLELIYNFRKRFKASLYAEPEGYDFMDIKIPEELKSKYKYCGDYILADGKIEGAPVLLTDRLLYLNDIVMEIGELQEAVCYSQIPDLSSTVAMDGRYAVVLLGRTSVKYTLMPKSSITKKFVCTLSAALQPFRNSGALSDSNNFAGFCIKCGGMDVKEGVLKSKCNICGTIGGGFLYRSRSRKNDVDEYIQIINDNLTKYEKTELFRDEENWLRWAMEAAKNVVDKEADSAKNKKHSEETMFCPFCGNKIKRIAKFCNYCGKKNNFMREQD